MRRASFDKHTNGKRNVLSKTYNSYGFASESSKEADCKYSVNYNNIKENYLQRSISADNVVIRSRGFKPSDRHDPVKRNFLESLTSKILHFDMESNESAPVNLQKLLTPATDTDGILQSKNRKMFASSYFYAPTHPTVEDQVELARRISHSLSDVKNMKSKGQSMYVNRKKRSVKWIHDGNGIEDSEEPSTPVHSDKIPLKCMMNPYGKVLDIRGIQALGEEVNIEPMPKNPEKLFNIVRDLNNHRGRGAEIFAKRRKRSEKWVVDQEQSQTPNTPGMQTVPTYSRKPETNGNSKFPNMSPFTSLATDPVVGKQSFYNPFTVDLSLSDTNPPAAERNQYLCNGKDCNHSTEVKKIYLREVAVGTDNDFPVDKSRSSIVKKSRRAALEPDIERHNIYHAGSSNNENATITTTNTNRRNCSCNKASLNKSNIFNTQNATNKEGKCYAREEYVTECVQSATNEREKLASNERENDGIRVDSEGNEYTPVPVKQLIQEFEKSCRPVLQYKQISPKVIPIVQHCSLDNDIARFFETQNSVKYNAERERRRVTGKQVYEEPVKLAKHVQDHCNNGYVSTDDTDYSSDETDSQMNDYPIEDIIYREKSESSSIMNGDQEYSSMYREEYSNRRRSVTSEEVETFCSNGDEKYMNTESEVPAESKSLLLSMLASQEDILETIKHLRSTPVLGNLLHSVSPDFKYTDDCPDVGKKLYEDNTYTGPKLASVNNLTNYNTAPRGWDQSLTYYRPIKLEKPQEIVYSDF
ncbi:uncharacterized protein LOC128897010 isoform X1 [Hylaeus anthracinus]|uniref:uncharacterized protein LOC128897010 isoform X1 n=2 Tax=Hylaeus anthracinus TaxID=313031 RepID=UPI0023B97838|nr:uncharacterized protein LOC128897010 isoform X1 [Hylaeus anthracinus]